ncbi:X protein [Jeilongvirus chaetodipodis]|uniref:X protein n=1 Tax=Paramyxoviridae sp. TaxID=1663356 RepID=A0AC61TNZ0_9MONO|nr:X protein [Paramyxoviridae sp.]
MDTSVNKSYYKGQVQNEKGSNDKSRSESSDVGCIFSVVTVLLVFCGISNLVVNLSMMSYIVSERPKHEIQAIQGANNIDKLVNQISDAFKDFKPRLNVLNSMVSYTIPSQISQAQVSISSLIRKLCGVNAALEKKTIYSTCVDPKRNETYLGVPLRELEELYNMSTKFCSFILTGVAPQPLRNARSLGLCEDIKMKCGSPYGKKSRRRCTCKKIRVYCPFNYTDRMRKMLFDMERNPCGIDI